MVKTRSLRPAFWKLPVAAERLHRNNVSNNQSSCTNQCTKRARMGLFWWKIWNAIPQKMPWKAGFPELPASVRDVEVAGSNPVAPTRQNIAFFLDPRWINRPIRARLSARIRWKRWNIWPSRGMNLPPPIRCVAIAHRLFPSLCHYRRPLRLARRGRRKLHRCRFTWEFTGGWLFRYDVM